MDFDANGELNATGEGQVSPMMALIMGRVGQLMKQRQEEDEQEAKEAAAKGMETEFKSGGSVSSSMGIEVLEGFIFERKLITLRAETSTCPVGITFSLIKPVKAFCFAQPPVPGSYSLGSLGTRAWFLQLRHLGDLCYTLEMKKPAASASSKSSVKKASLKLKLPASSISSVVENMQKGVSRADLEDQKEKKQTRDEEQDGRDKSKGQKYVKMRHQLPSHVVDLIEKESQKCASPCEFKTNCINHLFKRTEWQARAELG
eukprot:s184_g32.t1